MGTGRPEGPAAEGTAGQAVTIEGVGQLLGELADRLRSQIDTQWLDTLVYVPRHLFLPGRAWQLTDGDLIPLDRGTDPQRWLEAAYSDCPIVTQLDGETPTSSCSMPYMVLRMLQLLGAVPGHRVLEIGTGTGWNAALLAYRLGDKSVVTIEVDAACAAQAAENLDSAGYRPTLVYGDGTDGWKPAAPYGRIIATCAVNQVPYAWVEQTVSGGAVVVPWDSPLGLGALLRLEVVDGIATGRFVDTSSFMWLRQQQPTMPAAPDDFERRAVEAKATVSPDEIRDNLARFAIGLAVPDCQPSGYHTAPTIWLYAHDSWAAMDVTAGLVRQLGPRRLWDEVESAYSWWVLAGRPDLVRFGLTVTAERQWVWLDDPDQPVPQHP